MPVDALLTVLISLHQGGGAGSVNSVLRLALGLAGRGLAVRFVCPPASEVESEARAGGLEVHPLPLAKGHRFGNAARLRALLAAHPVDLINSHGSRDREALTCLGLTGRLPAPVVFTRRSYPRTTPLENWLASQVASRVVAISQPVADALRHRGTPAGKLVVIPNGVLLDRIDRPVTATEIRAWRERTGWEPSRRTVAIVARPKDQAVVLRALTEVRTPVRLVLAGLDGDALTGSLPPVPERHAVVRLPFTADIRPLYELVELALHPSRWDALPQAVLEAMALGKPVIASRATGNTVIIHDGEDGLLVEPMHAGAWAAAIDQVLSDPVLAARLGAAARLRAREGFPFERTVDLTLALYRAILPQYAHSR
jgi:glycosyltransferase involved in cell wall biosynthesis